MPCLPKIHTLKPCIVVIFKDEDWKVVKFKLGPPPSHDEMR